MKFLTTFIALILFSTSLTFSQDKSIRNTDETEIKSLLQRVQDAWSEGDAVGFADCFTDDVDYTVWNGFRFNGRENNIKGHEQIFRTIYKGTSLDFEIEKIRFLNDEIAVVLYSGAMLDSEGKPVSGVPRVRPLSIAQKLNGKWLFSVFQNTPIIAEGELVQGREPETK